MRGTGRRAGGAEGALNSVLALDGVCGGENTTGGFLRRTNVAAGGADAHEAVHLVRRIALPVTELRHRDGRDVGREVGTRLGGAGRGGASGEDLGDERNPRGARRRASRNASRRRAPPRRLIRGAATSRRERARVGEGRGGRGARARTRRMYANSAASSSLRRGGDVCDVSMDRTIFASAPRAAISEGGCDVAPSEATQLAARDRSLRFCPGFLCRVFTCLQSSTGSTS